MYPTFPRYLTFLFFVFLLSPAHAQMGPQGPVSVIVAPVKKAQFSDEIEALGTARANETVVVTADTSEKISEIHFEDGQEVKQDNLLVTLDKKEEEAQLRAAEAELKEAQSSYDRAKGLQGTKALSQATLLERRAILDQARAAVEAIKARIEELTIRAPFDGVLGLREVSVGTLVQPGERITTIDDLSQIKVDFDVPSLFLSSLKPGLPIIGRVEAYENKEFEGEVRTINTQIDPVTRTVKVRAILPNPEKLLKPGLLMTISILKNERETLLVPEEALIKRSDKNYVYTIETEGEKTIARQSEVKIGARRPGVVEITEGLSEGDKIVVHGTVKITDGAEISIRAKETEDTPLKELLNQKEGN